MFCFAEFSVDPQPRLHGQFCVLHCQSQDCRSIVQRNERYRKFFCMIIFQPYIDIVFCTGSILSRAQEPRKVWLGWRQLLTHVRDWRGGQLHPRQQDNHPAQQEWRPYRLHSHLRPVLGPAKSRVSVCLFISFPLLMYFCAFPGKPSRLPGCRRLRRCSMLAAIVSLCFPKFILWLQVSPPTFSRR